MSGDDSVAPDRSYWPVASDEKWDKMGSGAHRVRGL